MIFDNSNRWSLAGACGRLTKITGRTLSDGNGSFTYDDNGNLLTAANGAGTYTLSYNAADR